MTVTVTDQNEGAVVTGRQTIAVEENRDPTLTLDTYLASDPEGQPITRWSLSGRDGGDFLISENGDLTFRNTPDYDRPADSNRDNEYLVTVRAYDGRTYGSLDVTITVSNVNEHDPVIRSGSRTSFTYREEGTAALYTYRATDGDKDDVITWTTGGADGSLFEFDERNGLVFLKPPDYEDPQDSGANSEYNLTVVATDSGGLKRQPGRHRHRDGGGRRARGIRRHDLHRARRPGARRSHLHRPGPGGCRRCRIQLEAGGVRRRGLHHHRHRAKLRPTDLPQHPGLRPAGGLQPGQ